MIEVITKAAMYILVLMTVGTGFMYASFFNLRVFLCQNSSIH